MTITFGGFFAAIGSLLAAYALVYAGTAFLAPGFFLKTLSINDARFKKRGNGSSDKGDYTWTPNVTIVAVGIGLLILFYHTGAALTAWMPLDWHIADDDADVSSPLSGLQMMFALFATVAVFSALDDDASAHQLVAPKGLELSAWARRGYNRATEAIADDRLEGPPTMEPSDFAMEFLKGYALRLEEQGAADAQAGKYRATAFGDAASYIEAWRRAAQKLRQSGWRHPDVDTKMTEFDKLESAARLREEEAHKAAEKANWAARLGFDPEQVLRDTE